MSSYPRTWAYLTKRLLSSAPKIGCDFAGVVLAGIAILICVDIFTRRVLNCVWFGTFEVVTISLVIVICFSFAYVEVQGRQIRVEIVTSRFKVKLARVSRMGSHALSAGFFGCLAVVSWLGAFQAWQSHDTLQGILMIPKVIPWSWLALGASLVTIVLIRKLIGDIQALLSRP